MFIDSLKISLKALLEAKVPVMVSGPAGVGKSSIVRQISNDFQEEWEVPVHFVDIRLTMFEPSDVRGVLYPDIANKNSTWLTPEMFPQDPDWVGIILLDELPSVPPLVQAAAYQLVLDRKIGEYTLPEGAMIMAAGNTITDRGVHFKMAAPLANRMIHLTLEVSVAKWKEWAYDRGIDPTIIGYVSWREDHLYKFDPSSKELAFASGRTWEYVNTVLGLDLPDYEKQECICGAVGRGVGTDFWAYRELLHGVVEIETILDMKKDYELPKDITVCHGVNSALISRFQNATLKENEALAIFRYMDKIESDEMRAATFIEFRSSKVKGLMPSKFQSVRETFNGFYERIKHLIPVD